MYQYLFGAIEGFTVFILMYFEMPFLSIIYFRKKLFPYFYVKKCLFSEKLLKTDRLVL